MGGPCFVFWGVLLSPLCDTLLSHVILYAYAYRITCESRVSQSGESKTPQKTKHGPPTGSLALMSFCGVTLIANKLANLPIHQKAVHDVHGTVMAPRTVCARLCGPVGIHD